MGLDRIVVSKKRFIVNFILAAIMILVILDTFRVWLNYHLTESVKALEATPELRKDIQNDGRLFSYGIEGEWTTKYFVKTGWNKNPEVYDFLRNSFAQNSNLLYGVSQYNAYAGMFSKRSTLAMVAAAGFITTEGETLKIGDKSQWVLNAGNVKYLTTTKNINSDKWQLLDSVSAYSTTINLYQNSEVNPRAFIPNGYKIATTVSEFRSLLENGTDISKTVALEQEIDLPNNQTGNRGSAQIIEDNNNIVKINVNLNEKSLVVLSDSYYPGWKAYVDGQETKIYPTNVNSRSVIVPTGQHNIIYKYDSQTIKIGTLVTVISLIITFLLLTNPKIRNYRLSK
jgi:hypothetical protein